MNLGQIKEYILKNKCDLLFQNKIKNLHIHVLCQNLSLEHKKN